MTEFISYPIPLPMQPVVWRGDPFDWTLCMAAGENPDGTLVDPVDLTGYGTDWTATYRSSSSSASAEFAVDPSRITDGVVVLYLPPSQTRALRTNVSYYFDVQATNGPRSPFTVWRGSFTAAGDNTAP